LEILVIDGGSNDRTPEIAKQYGCTILINQKKLPEFAKHIGIHRAGGQYCMFLDSDEVLTNNHSLESKFNLLENGSRARNVLIGGLKNPPGYPFINEYATRVGDPFSFFIYGVDADDYISSLAGRFSNKEEYKDHISYHTHHELLPICDSGGHFFDLSYLKKHFDTSNPKVVSRIFDQMVGKTHAFIVVKDDYVRHYSNSSFSGYLSKIYWRIVNNIHHADTSVTGFSEREKNLSVIFSLKKILFIPLSLTLLWPIYSTILFFIKTRNPRYLLHLYISVFTASSIIIQFVRKLLDMPPRLTAYGQPS